MENREAKWIFGGAFSDLIVCSHCKFVLKSISECFELENPDICPKCKYKMIKRGVIE